MQEEYYEAKIKLSKFWLMIYNCFNIFGCAFILYHLWLQGCEEFNNQVTNENSMIMRVFHVIELIPLIELLHHFIGFQKIKMHMFINMFINIWIIYGVLPIYPSNKFIMHWVILRCISKLIRHFYNAYLAMDLKFEVYFIDYIRMTSYYIIYVLEYIYSLILVIVALPELKGDKLSEYSLLMPNLFNFNFDYRFVFFFYICASIPNFINTFIYLHRKRQEQLGYAKAHSKND